MKIILIKYGELTTKKDNRKVFINILYNNIKKALINYKVNIIKTRDRMYIETEENIDEVVNLIGNNVIEKFTRAVRGLYNGN